MADGLADKIKQTQNSFPPRPPGAVAACPSSSPDSKAPTPPPMPLDMKTAFSLTQQMMKTLGVKSTPEPQKEKKAWVEILLVDLDGKPVPNVRYRVTLPDGTIQEGRLNEHGQAGYYKIEPGECKVTFPDLDKDAWD